MYITEYIIDMDTPDDKQRKLAELLRGEGSDGEFVRDLRERDPFFTLADALMLRRAAEAGLPLPDADELGRLQARLALNSCDAAAAGRLVSGEAGEAEGFYPPVAEQETPTTESAIDTFLTAYGSRNDEEDALLERLIFNPVPDYALTLEAEADVAAEPAGSGLSDLPDKSDRSDPSESSDGAGVREAPAVPAEPEKAAETPRKVREGAGNQALLSESLAKIFIKTRRYDKAYEILERLSLEFPEKSRYFADQLRFLRKLILIEEHRRKQQESRAGQAAEGEAPR